MSIWSGRSAFENSKPTAGEQVTANHCDNDKLSSAHTTAFDSFWPDVVSQVPLEKLKKSYVQQRYGLLVYLSGRFDRTKYGWCVQEKEAYAVMDTVQRVHRLLDVPNKFNLYTGHNILIFLLDPLSIIPDLSHTSTRKVLHWAVRLGLCSYTCIHICGEDNAWDYLLVHWSAARTVRQLVQELNLPNSFQSSFDGPSEDSLCL